MTVRRRHPFLRAAVLLASLTALLGVVPGTAEAGPNAETSIMDDQLLLNGTRTEVDRDMAVFRRFGVDRLRVSAFWNQLAPNALGRQKPDGFDGSDPNAPGYNFAPLDRVVDSARAHGLRVMLTISPPAPVWASADPSRDNGLWKPRPAEFGAFTTALVRRYGAAVDHWGISNEPNQGVWLQPQSDRSGLVAPHLYRALVAAAYPRIKQLDPSSTALVGELASTGREGRGATVNTRPIRFLRAMTCRDKRNRRVRTGRCRNFRPVMADAIGHHPYQLLAAPNLKSASSDDAGIGDGRRFVRAIDRLQRSGGLRAGRPGKLGVYYTEFGYQTNPPDPFAGISLARQRLYLQQAAKVVYRTPRVRGLNQFRLTDGELSGFGPNRFREFQSGLLFKSRKRKPAWYVFAHPFVISGDRFWGQVRPGGRHRVTVEYRGGRQRGRWRTVASVLTSARGYFSFPLPGRKPGFYRYRYRDPGGRSAVIRAR